LLLILLSATTLGVLGYHFAWKYLETATVQSLTLLTLISLFYTEARKALLDFSSRIYTSWCESIEDDSSVRTNDGEAKSPAKHEKTKAFVDTIFSILVLLSMATIWNHGNVFELALSKVILCTWTSGDSLFFLSLYSVTTSLFVLTISLLLIRALPTFFELFIFPKFEINASLRYTIISVSRYIACALTLFLTLGYLQVDLSKVGWLVAALGVGLGFGLQEIFSNFICGLILLIERPIRVGDTVTIDGVTGQVTQINTRSSTITDWDKLENVIPNKTFITQKLTNWSLSNQLSRIIIPIKVDYDSDPKHIKQLLCTVAEGNVSVVAEPKPFALFIKHAASSLDFELRVYTKDIGARATVQDTLLTDIHETLKREGITIPYPQQDMNIRSFVDK